MTELTDYSTIMVDLAPASQLNNQGATGLQDTILQASAQGETLPGNVVPGPMNMVPQISTDNSDPNEPVANQILVNQQKNNWGLLLIAGVAAVAALHYSQSKKRR
jgi:hypothetical protein